MRRFDFRLEAFLRIKAYKEKKMELELAKALGNHVQLTGLQRDLQMEIKEYSCCTVEGLLLDVFTLQTREEYRKRLEKELSQVEKRLHQSEIEKNKAQEQYAEAAKERKILEKLKERKAREYYTLQRKEEDKLLDEVANRFRGD
ncbi:MAG: flagellar export protein FliJ [Spirochaetales bacterium]